MFGNAKTASERDASGSSSNGWSPMPRSNANANTALLSHIFIATDKIKFDFINPRGGGIHVHTVAQASTGEHRRAHVYQQTE